MSLKTFEIENAIVADNSLYAYDAAEQKALMLAKPWRTDPTYFTGIKISAIALLRMAMHARSGGAIEVMGVMTGKIVGREFIVMDAYALPVEGTETRVNAMGEGTEYLVQYHESLVAVDRPENVVGWYHSHPGYGCWLSGIDVGTQDLNQSFQDPWVAIVVDPNQTISAGKVEIGAFRTYPKDYKPDTGAGGDFSNGSGGTTGNGSGIPLAKQADFGAHADRYYPLKVSYFKGEADSALLNILWNRYWATTLAQSGISLNHNYINSKVQDVLVKTDLLAEEINAANGTANGGGPAATNTGRSSISASGAASGGPSRSRPETDRCMMFRNMLQNKPVAPSPKIQKHNDWYQSAVHLASSEVQGLIGSQVRQQVYNF